MPKTDPEVRKTKELIMKIGTVPKIMEKQDKNGYWDVPEKFYRAKYKGTVWQLIILAELGADAKNKNIKKACEFIIKYSQDNDSGGFSYDTSIRSGGGNHSCVVPCLTGNMVWSLIKLGLLKDPRVQKGINYITKYQRFDDGIQNVPKEWPYDRYKMCFGKHTCHMGAMKALKALAEIPVNERTKPVKDMLKTAVEYVLIHHVYKRSHDLTRIAKPGWTEFGFPLMYQTDVVELLGILTKLGIKDNRMQEAIDLVVSKQDNRGRWLLENTFNGKFQTSIERKDKPSKWITLKALEVLKRFYI
jgi:hypothetical protein